MTTESYLDDPNWLRHMLFAAVSRFDGQELFLSREDLFKTLTGVEDMGTLRYQYTSLGLRIWAERPGKDH